MIPHITHIVGQNLQLELMDAAAPVDADAHQHNAGLVHVHADGIRRAIARVPTAALARFGEAVRRCFDGVERVQSINLKRKDTKRDAVNHLLHNHTGLIIRNL